MVDLPAWTGDRWMAYTGERSELLPLVPALNGLVVDVGCSNGAFGRMLKREKGASTIVLGIESNPQLAKEAEKYLNEVLTADAWDGIAQLRDRGTQASLLVFADVLEHVQDPWRLLDEAVGLVPDGGHVLISLPNVAHVDTLWGLLRGRWPHRDRGIHDVTHLRFFARRDVLDLLQRPPLHRVVVRVEARPATWSNGTNGDHSTTA